MDKVIVYENGKCEPIVFDVSTEEKQEEAYRQLFEVVDRYAYSAFRFSTESQKEKFERLQDPEVEYEDSVMIETERDGYVEKISKDEWRERIQHAKSRLSVKQERQQMYEAAKEGDADAARKLLDTMKGQPYVDYHELKIQNQ